MDLLPQTLSAAHRQVKRDRHDGMNHKQQRDREREHTEPRHDKLIAPLLQARVELRTAPAHSSFRARALHLRFSVYRERHLVEMQGVAETSLQHVAHILFTKCLFFHFFEII